jgi:hypothetical protein
MPIIHFLPRSYSNCVDGFAVFIGAYAIAYAFVGCRVPTNKTQLFTIECELFGELLCLTGTKRNSYIVLTHNKQDAFLKYGIIRVTQKSRSIFMNSSIFFVCFCLIEKCAPHRRESRNCFRAIAWIRLSTCGTKF